MLNEKFALRAAVTYQRSKREDFQILIEAVNQIGDAAAGQFLKSAEPAQLADAAMPEITGLPR